MDQKTMIKSHNSLKDTKKFFSVKAYHNNETLYSYKYLHNKYLLIIIIGSVAISDDVE